MSKKTLAIALAVQTVKVAAVVTVGVIVLKAVEKHLATNSNSEITN